MTCPGSSLRGPAHEKKEEEGGGTGRSTKVPPISDTQKEVNGGLINPLLHTPSQILTTDYDDKITSALQHKLNYAEATTDTSYLVHRNASNWYEFTEAIAISPTEMPLSMVCANTPDSAPNLGLFAVIIVNTNLVRDYKDVEDRAAVAAKTLDAEIDIT